MFYKYVIFDMDGLIFDSEYLIYEIVRDRMALHGYDLPPDFFATTLGICNEDSDILFAERYPGYAYNADTDIEEFKKRIADGHLRVKPGLPELLEHLEKLGVRKCIASSNERWAIDLCLNSAGLTERFEFILSAESVEQCKPAPDLFLAAAEKLGASPGECLVLEDSMPGLNAAFAAGCPVIAIPDMAQPPQDVAERCLGVHETLHDVTKLFS